MRNLFIAFLVGSALFAQAPQPSPTVAGSGGPGGSTLQLQYNNAGAFGGIAEAAWDNATKMLDFLNGTDPIVSISTDPNGNNNNGIIFGTNFNNAIAPSVSTNTGEPGAEVILISVGGGNTTIATTGTGGPGGSAQLNGALGGAAPSAVTASTGGAGGNVAISAGQGGPANNAANVGVNTGGNAGTITIQARAGGTAVNGSSNTGGNGGTIDLLLGDGGAGSTAVGTDGSFNITGGVRANAPLQRWKANAGTVLASIGATGIPSFPSYGTNTNCSSAASPAVCSAASAGSVVVAASATTVVVNTTAVTASSQIMLMSDSSLATKIGGGITCNATIPALYGVTARTAGVSFTVTATAPITNPWCFSFALFN